MKKLGFLIVVFSGLIGVLANASQILAYIESHPDFPCFWRKPVTVQPIQRLANIVLIIENVGGVNESNQIDSLIDLLTKRLLPDDSLSVIVFTDFGSQFILERQTGVSLGNDLLDKLRHIIPVRTISGRLMDEAYFKAKDFLSHERDPNHAVAILVLSSKTTDESLNSWFNKMRTDTARGLFKFGTRAGEGNRRL